MSLLWILTRRCLGTGVLPDRRLLVTKVLFVDLSLAQFFGFGSVEILPIENSYLSLGPSRFLHFDMKLRRFWSVPEPMPFEQLGLALSEKQIPQIVEKNERATKWMEYSESRVVLRRQATGTGDPPPAFTGRIRRSIQLSYGRAAEVILATVHNPGKVFSVPHFPELDGMVCCAPENSSIYDLATRNR